jgi:hypothetical protein
MQEIAASDVMSADDNKKILALANEIKDKLPAELSPLHWFFALKLVSSKIKSVCAEIGLQIVEKKED